MADAEELRVTVNLKFIHRERLSVQCPPDILISELKRKVLEVYTRHVENDEAKDVSAGGEGETATGSLRLIYKGKVMKDDQALGSYNFVHDDTIHAVFGRPQTAASAASSSSSEATGADSARTTAAGSTATSSAAATHNDPGGATSASAGMRDLGNGLMMGQFSFDSDETSPLPDLGNLINSMLSGFAGGSDPEGASASIHFTTSGSPPLGTLSSSATDTSTVATSTTASTTTASATPSSSTSASSTSSATSTSSAFTPAVSSSAAPAPTPASSSPTAPLSYSAVRTSTPSPAQASPSNLASNATSLLNQAASLRRMIPALELSPLSQPAGLSTEMYSLGNALREAGDTFLAVHRQLQFVATRFLTENNLNTSERLRLRTRVHQLVSILDQVGSLSRSVSSNLAASSYGPGAAQMPPQVNQTTGHQPSAIPRVDRPLTTSVSVSPTVNIFSGAGVPGGGANAPNLGNSIADLLQVVNSLGSGRPPATATPNSTVEAAGATPTTTTAAASSSSSTAQSIPGGLGSLLNFVSALTSGARPSQSPLPSNGSSSQGPAAGANQRPTTTNAASYSAGNMQTPASPSPDAAIAASIPSRPLSTLFSQVMRDMNTLDEWDPETAEDLLRRIYPHLRHRVRSLFGSTDNTSGLSLRKKWCENAVEEMESATRGVLESHAQVYVRDRLRCRVNEVTLDHLLEILLGANTEDLHDQAHLNASLDKLRKLLRKFCTTVHAEIAEQTSPIEAVRIAANVLSSVLITEDLSVRRSAEGLANRVNREVTSLLKTRTA